VCGKSFYVIGILEAGQIFLWKVTESDAGKKETWLRSFEK
jgi:hypothetical protein